MQHIPFLGVVENKKFRPVITQEQYEDAYRVWINDHYRLWECNGSRKVGVYRTWSPLNVDDDPTKCPRTIPRMEDRKHGLSTWLQAYGIHDPAALRRPELVIAGELEGGD